MNLRYNMHTCSWLSLSSVALPRAGKSWNMYHGQRRGLEIPRQGGNMGRIISSYGDWGQNEPLSYQNFSTFATRIVNLLRRFEAPWDVVCDGGESRIKKSNKKQLRRHVEKTGCRKYIATPKPILARGISLPLLLQRSVVSLRPVIDLEYTRALVRHTLQCTLRFALLELLEIEIASSESGVKEPDLCVSMQTCITRRDVPLRINGRNSTDIRSRCEHKLVEDDPLRLGIQSTGWVQRDNLGTQA